LVEKELCARENRHVRRKGVIWKIEKTAIEGRQEGNTGVGKEGNYRTQWEGIP